MIPLSLILAIAVPFTIIAVLWRDTNSYPHYWRYEDLEYRVLCAGAPPQVHLCDESAWFTSAYGSEAELVEDMQPIRFYP